MLQAPPILLHSMVTTNKGTGDSYPESSCAVAWVGRKLINVVGKDGERVSEISREQISHLAKLSRLALSEEELDQFANQIDEIVDAVSAVGKVNTEGVEPMSHPHSITTSMREDVIVRTLNAEQALDQAPAVEDDRFVVPQILGGE